MRIYLLASLPSLSPHAPAPLTLFQFLERCAQALPANELRQVEDICDRPPGGTSRFAESWRQVIRQIHLFNDQQRITRLADPTLHPRTVELSEWNLPLERALEAAWQSGDPLKREEALIQLRWAWLDEARRARPYALEDVLGYTVQLQLLERRDVWQEDPGLRQLTEQTNTVLAPLRTQLRQREMSV